MSTCLPACLNGHAGKGSVGPLDSLTERNQERFRVLMESGNNKNIGALQKAIDYYQSCMDWLRVEAESLPVLTNLLVQLGERKGLIAVK